MKKVTVVGLALIVMLLFVTSCGISQEEYNRVSSDLTAAQTQIQSLQGDLSTKDSEMSAKESELTAAQTQIQSLQGDLSAKDTKLSVKESKLTAAQTQIQSLQGDLSIKNSELEAARERLEQGKARVEILNAILIPSITGELDGMTESEALNYFLEWRDKVIAVGDSTLTTKFQAIVDTQSGEATLSFFLYLLESIPKALGYHDVSSKGI